MRNQFRIKMPLAMLSVEGELVCPVCGQPLGRKQYSFVLVDGVYGGLAACQECGDKLLGFLYEKKKNHWFEFEPISRGPAEKRFERMLANILDVHLMYAAAVGIVEYMNGAAERAAIAEPYHRLRRLIEGQKSVDVETSAQLQKMLDTLDEIEKTQGDKDGAIKKLEAYIYPFSLRKNNATNRSTSPYVVAKKALRTFADPDLEARCMRACLMYGKEGGTRSAPPKGSQK